MVHARQDLRHFLEAYQAAHPEDVLTVDAPLSADQDITALVWSLAAQGRHPLLLCNQVSGLGVPVVTNIFGSRERVARLLGTDAAGIHAAYQARTRAMVAPRDVGSGPVCDIVESNNIDLSRLPLINHFQTDRAPYITNGVIAADHPDTGAGNLSYHRSMLHSKTELATSLHSRGHLWRILQAANDNGQPLRVAMVIGAHPLFMLAASARLPLGVDERHVAGGLMGEPLEIVRTPKYGIAAPAYAEYVLEGVIDAKAHVVRWQAWARSKPKCNIFHGRMLHDETVQTNHIGRTDVDPNATPARVQAGSDGGEFKAPAFVRLAGTGAQWLESGARSQAGGASAPYWRLLFDPGRPASTDAIGQTTG